MFFVILIAFEISRARLDLPGAGGFRIRLAFRQRRIGYSRHSLVNDYLTFHPCSTCTTETVNLDISLKLICLKFCGTFK